MSFLVSLLIALASASAFGTSGALAKGLLIAGWSPAAAVTWRVAVGAVALLVPAALTMRGRWRTLRVGWKSVVLFGLVAVAGCQLAYFLAVGRLSVAVALLLEYCGVLLVVLWHWFRRGRRPRAATLWGSALAVAGLALVLDVLGPVRVDLIGAMWGLVAAAGLATYYVVSEDQSHGVPPLALATGGLVVGAVVLGLAGAVGLLDMTWAPVDVELAGRVIPWWLTVAALGLFAVMWAWLLLAEIPAPIQLAGGALIVAGVVVVRLDEEPAAEEQATIVEPLGSAPSD